ncbi:glucose-1-phosphate cytidylyltransferase [Anaerobacterium chartisolvens]|uniref:Glucose-1-phosphate cytidylyltransferase n=1 Tax=Anaerobacterium chartisolvens TaxID=1297424 RepID=A0A369B5U0_9FIRM|nr:glucose-1-phosphate cytidylyltransferase [Anaerobacterium chartisolvens]RCX16882.1 glucose-1-phosphate cytidylyltransferase [Anaerobacterium chartisolvens]
MKVVILAGGYGTRISEESMFKPKPMIEIGEYPILHHIMRYYSHYGFNEFIICCGYKANIIKEYFSNYFLHTSDVTFDFRYSGNMSVHRNIAEPWRVTIIDTGLYTQTGGRIKRICKYTENKPFLLTYGDGLSNVDLNDLVEFHKQHNAIVTLTAVQPSGRFGAIDVDSSGIVTSFREKPKGDMGWVNGGFFVCQPDVFDYIDGDDSIWEHDPLEKISSTGRLMAYKHHGFWSPMDTVRDKFYLEELWKNGTAPWKL